jgi:MerR family Zn(II)-responsive transcriptional regulator of zntA
MKPIVQEGEKLLQIGRLAGLTGKSVRALYLYEEKGLLEPETRSEGGFRLYSDEAVSRVLWIERMQQLGFSLPKIKEILSRLNKTENGPEAMALLRGIYIEKLSEIRERIRSLEELASEMEQSLGYLKECNSCSMEEVISACACCRREGIDRKKSTLIVGPTA